MFKQKNRGKSIPRLKTNIIVFYCFISENYETMFEMFTYLESPSVDGAVLISYG